MATLDDFYAMAQRVSNWGRWGEADEIGTLNFITPETVREGAALVRLGKTFALGMDFGSNGPQGAFHFRNNPVHVMTVDGGDASALIEHGSAWAGNPKSEQLSSLFAGPFRFNDDMIVMPLQAATQWDALSHVYYDDMLYNGFPASSTTSLGATRCSIDKVDIKGIASRAVLLDVVKFRGPDRFLPAGQPIMPDELDAIAAAQGVEVRRGDILLIHTGWTTEFVRTGDKSLDASGLHWTCALWLHEREVAAVAADNLQVEDAGLAVDGTICPMHMLALRDMGLTLGEYFALGELAADCAEDGIYEFFLVAPPLRVIGAVGSPINPIAFK